VTRYGIDFGTSKCCVAVVGPDGRAQVLPTRHGERLMPAAVAFGAGAEGRPVIGGAARRQAQGAGRAYVSGIKRLFGRRVDDPEARRAGPGMGGGVVSAPNGDAWVDVLGTKTSPPSLAAHLLAELRATAQQQLRATGNAEAVVAVPPSYDHAARQALKDAAELAGIPIARLLSEAAAAAIGHGVARRPRATLAVCDLGGGRFDASIVQIENGVVEVLATAGEPCGGDDFDRRIAARLGGEVRAGGGADLEADPATYAQLLEDVQKLKHAAVDAGQGTIQLAVPGRDPFARTVKRLEIEAWTRDLVDRLDRPCREALSGARVKPGEVREVLVCGGAARLPAVVRKIEQVFGCPAARAQSPDEVVAAGAALYAGALDGVPESLLALDPTPHVIGIRAGGRQQTVIARGTPMPARGERVFTTVKDGQKEIAIDVVEGEGGGRWLGRWFITGLPEARAGEVLMLVDVTVDGDGIVGVAARPFGGGTRPKVRMEPASGLQRADVRRGHA
jgi:molecular chaperone DnaK